MTATIILSTIALMMFIFALYKGDQQTRMLTGILTLSILMNFISSLVTVGIIIFMLIALYIAFITYQRKDTSNFSKFTTIAVGIVTFIVHLYAVINWPFDLNINSRFYIVFFSESPLLTFMYWCMFALIICYFIMMKQKMLNRTNFGYLTIMNALFIQQFFQSLHITEGQIFGFIIAAFIIMLIYLVGGLMIAKDKGFYRWNLGLFLSYTIIAAAFLLYPSGSNYGPGLAAITFGTLILIAHFFTIIIIKLVQFLKKI